MKVRCDINGLDCPNCAAELERLIAKHTQIKGCNLNFTTSALVLDVADDADEEQIVEICQGIADDFEEGIAIELRD